MRIRATVIAASFSDALQTGLASLDRQTLEAAEVEVLVADDGTEPGATARLADLVAHRTNVRRVAITPGTPARELLDTVLSRAQGDYVLVLPDGRRLMPEALARLCDHADASGADICIGLTGRVDTRPPGSGWPSTADPAQLSSDDPLRGYRAGRLHRRAGSPDALLLAELSGIESRIPPDAAAAAVTSVLCFVDGDGQGKRVPAETDHPGFRVRVSEAAWSAGALEVTAQLTATDESDLGSCGVSVFSPATGVEWLVEDVATKSTPDGTTLVMRLDPEHVRGVGTLPDGIWWPTVRVGDEVRLFDVPPRLAHGATVFRRPVVSFAQKRRLGIDVGGHGHQLIRRLTIEASRVAEDSRGSLLTSGVENVDLAPGVRLEGKLMLGELPVVAWLERKQDGVTMLSAWVSGLAGTVPLSTRFTKAPPAPTGCRLVIDGVGGMSVRPAPPDPGRVVSPPTAAPVPHGRATRVRRIAGRALRSIRR